MRQNLTDKIYTTSRAAKRLGISASYIRKMILEGKMQAEKIGHDWILTERALKKYKPQRMKKLKEKLKDGASK